MSKKNELINTILHNAMKSFSEDIVTELKNILRISLYNYSVEKITTTDVSIGNYETTQGLLEYFAICKISSGRTRKTIQQYLLVANQLCNMLHKELNEITSDDVIYFLAKYPYTKTPTVSGCTMDTKRRYLSSIFGLLKKHKKIEENPMDMVEQIKYVSKVKQPLNDREISNINEAIKNTKNKVAKVRNDAIMQLCFDTGVRVSELTGINISDIDFYKKEIKVLGKGNKERIVMFSDDTEKKIKDYLELRNNYEYNSPLFMDIKNRNRLKSSGVRSMMKRLRKSSGVNRLHPHLIRASMASNLARQGIAIDIIAKYLGHSGLDVIQRYVINSQEHIKQEMHKVGLG